jgi:hypothetical protein
MRGILKVIHSLIDANIALVLIYYLLLLSSGLNDGGDIPAGIIINPLAIKEPIEQIPVINLPILKNHPAIALERAIPKMSQIILIGPENSPQPIRTPLLITITHIR